MSHEPKSRNQKNGYYSQVKTIISTPLPFEVRKKMMNANGYNRFGEILNPQNSRWKIRDRDNLTTHDIEGAVPDTYGKLSELKGRDYINIGDIKGTQSAYKIDKFTNKSHFNLQTKDVTEEGKKRFVKNYSPLEPSYVMYSKSRRRRMVIQDDETSKPRKLITPKTRRKDNRIDDIEGAQPKKLTWVRKILNPADNETELNTGLPMNNNLSSNNISNLAMKGRNITHDSPHQSCKKVLTRVDSCTQRASPHRKEQRHNRTENNSIIIDKKVRDWKSEKKRHAVTGRNSNSPSRDRKLQTPSLPNLAVPRSRRDLPEIDQKWSKSKKYSNLELNSNSEAKLSANNGKISTKGYNQDSRSYRKIAKSRNANHTIEQSISEGHVRVTNFLEKNRNQNHSLNVDKRISNSRCSPLKNPDGQGYYEGFLKAHLQSEHPYMNFLKKSNYQNSSVEPKINSLRNKGKNKHTRKLPGKVKGSKTNMIVTKEKELDNYIKLKMRQGYMNANPLQPPKLKNTGSLPYF
ncbi:unnamed protein product [Moneuplotes crassus]|uniref:Uncharacterized protein n=1 Tax=Euplotes crassus TaxID=5936 RepID=A0AAD1U6D9_EUPCR|nr:unnamed protein product [Moneuplotes crassus]